MKFSQYPNIAVIGVEHRHIYGMLEGMIAAGCKVSGWWTESSNVVTEGFVKRFPTLKRFNTKQELLDNQDIQVVLIADIPSRRAGLAIEAMNHGKDVMTDKPGCISEEELIALKKTVFETKKFWSIDFSERFEVPAVSYASELIKAGEIGTVIQTIGLGPHRLNLATRPNWFFDPKSYGGILCDIASHQIDQFLHFTNSISAEIVTSSVANYANPSHAGLEDFGEVVLQSNGSHGYIRVDWYTADALPTWGDGRLFILGTRGTIEIRKYIDIAGRTGTDHVLMVNNERVSYFDASKAKLNYFLNFSNDVMNRTETSCSQAHTFLVTELALKSQKMASRLGFLSPKN